MQSRQPRYVGIDLGTTFSGIAYVDRAGRPVSVPNRDGSFVTPSVVMIGSNREIKVGEVARRAAIEHPDLVAVNFKRDMGDKFYHQPVGGKEFSPEALSALVLRRLREDFESQIGPVRGAVITVPAYFGDLRRKATQDAGRIAALDVVDIINEPTAAALANAFRQYLEAGGSSIRFEIAAIAATAPSTTLVFDLGGGTFDATIIRINGEHFNVLATGGEVRLGGVDFDRRLAMRLADDFEKHHGHDARKDENAKALLFATAEQVKIALSAEPQTTARLRADGQDMAVPMTRDRFEHMTADLLTRLQMTVEMLLEDALLTWDRIDDVLLVGGASRMPMVCRMLERISGRKPNMATAPEQIVAHGAAIHAAITQMATSAATVTTDGARTFGSSELAESETGSGENILDFFDPPVVEAAQKIQMADVNSHSLGVIVRSSKENRIVNSVVIPGNTPIPTARTKVFGTEAANQRIIRVPVVEGSSRDPRGCTQIGECVIRDLPKGLPQGSPVEVVFKYDRSGRIHVQATETTTQFTGEASIQRDSGFDQKTIEELTRAVRELTVE